MNNQTLEPNEKLEQIEANALKHRGNISIGRKGGTYRNP